MKVMTANSRDRSSKATTKKQYFGGINKVGDDVSASTQSMTEGDSESSENEPMSPPQFPCFVTIENIQESVACNTSCSYERKIHQTYNTSYQQDLDDSDDDSSFAPLEDDDDAPEADFYAVPDFTSPTDPSANVNIDCVSSLPQDNSPGISQELDYETFNEDNFVQPKALPGFSNTHKMVCVSFLEPNVATAVACQVLDEAFRLLRPGGLLYVIDKGGGTVRKHPTMRQWLTRVRDPTVKHFVYEIETRAILQANGLGHTTLDENHKHDTWSNDDMVRWVGIKS